MTRQCKYIVVFCFNLSDNKKIIWQSAFSKYVEIIILFDLRITKAEEGLPTPEFRLPTSDFRLDKVRTQDF